MKDKHVYNEAAKQREANVKDWLLSREREQELRTNQHERVSAESAEARLQQVRTDQRERLAAESAEKRSTHHTYIIGM